MKKKIVLFGSIFVLLSFSHGSSQQFGTKYKKNKNLEQDAINILMKKLENLNKLCTTNSDDVFNKEIESLKKQIDELQKHNLQRTGDNNLGDLIENESKDDFSKKKIFGVDEEDLGNCDGDFIGQNTADTSVQASDGEGHGINSSNQNNEHSPESPREETSDGSSTTVEGKNPQDTSRSVSETSERSSEGNPQVDVNERETSEVESADSLSITNSEEQENPHSTLGQPPQGNSEGGEEASQQSENGNTQQVKYLDKLYDEILQTTDGNGINDSQFHSKYNDFRKKYEFTMNNQEYGIVKKLFDVCFKKEGESEDTSSLVNMFKNVLNDEKFEKEFENFIHGFYGFAKRHNYLRNERLTNVQQYTDFLKNVVNLLNTIEIK
ncbi:merozoite surface protein 7 [Plasmodium gonderi]|uniref:Merozoite surface protein 7 n=1 Tax=Plasmodium gonderi TaxID=77519 RepID=A0A1Y1JL82_PLAGO|nr:merozoite surface protein 7 [Plasmodium gonderi]GAW82215.1 merozoite surface protein 7 [Plasmodium gonderi]